MLVHNPDLYCYSSVWALPLSLATTYGISVDFFSCGYLDVSVPHVSLCYTMDSCNSTWAFTSGGFPHSEICGSMAICASPQLIAAYHVLHRLLVPRHSPYALNSLTLVKPPYLLRYVLVLGSLKVIVFLPSQWDPKSHLHTSHSMFFTLSFCLLVTLFCLLILLYLHYIFFKVQF